MAYPTIDPIKTGKRIRELMKDRQMTVREIQTYLNLSCVQSVYHWLDGRSLPAVDHLYALSSLFCVPMDDIVRGVVPCGNNHKESSQRVPPYDKVRGVVPYGNNHKGCASRERRADVCVHAAYSRLRAYSKKLAALFAAQNQMICGKKVSQNHDA